LTIDVANKGVAVPTSGGRLESIAKEVEHLQGTKPDVFQAIWDEATKLSDDWIKFYTSIWVLEKLQPADEDQRKEAIGAVLSVAERLPIEHRSEALFHIAWKLPVLNQKAAEEALDELLKDYPHARINWSYIAEAFAEVDTESALKAANRQADFLTRTRASAKIAAHTNPERAKEVLHDALDKLDGQPPSFLVTQSYVEIAQALSKIEPAKSLALLRKALDYDMKEERLIDACMLYLQIAQASSGTNADTMVQSINRAIQTAEQMGDPRRTPHWLDAAGTASQLKYLLIIASSIRTLAPGLEVSVLKKACLAVNDLDLEDFCEAVAEIAVEAKKIDTPELAKELLERARRLMEKSQADRTSSFYASCTVNLAIACAYADRISFDEMLNNCVNYLDELMPASSFFLLQKLATGVLDARAIELTRIFRAIIDTAKQIESRNDRAIALAQAAEVARSGLSEEECLALATEAIEAALHIDNTSRRCITLLSVVAAAKSFASAHAKHAYEEAVHAALALDPKLVRGLMQEFIEDSAINPIAATKLTSKLREEGDKCTLLAGIASKIGEYSSQENR
jgi:hypothetical protein